MTPPAPSQVKSQEGLLAKPETLDKNDLFSPAPTPPGIHQLAANARDVPYQSLIKLWPQEKLRHH